MITATKEDRELVIDILVSAFKDVEDENTINFLVGYGKRRIPKMRNLMGHIFDNSMISGEVYLSDNKTSCLLVSFSEKEKVSLKTIFLDIKVFFNCIGFSKIFSVLKRDKLVKQFYPKDENYIKPVILGAYKEAYGNGSAARLVIRVMLKYKKNKKPVIVDTVSEYNINLYKKFGFRVLETQKSLGFPLTLLRLN